MRFTLAVAMCQPEELVPLAVAAERSGWGGVAVPDSVFFPREVSAGYPYTADGARFWDEDTPFVDPFVAIPAMAASTSRIRFVTNVLKMSLRHPLLVAKWAGSFAAMFPDRLALGLGLSWIPEEFEWLGVEKSTRGVRLDESLVVMRECWQPGWASGSGSHYPFGPLAMSPRPESAVPLLVGGHSEPALRRAARLADGWVTAMVSVADLAAMVGRLASYRPDGSDLQGFEVVATPLVGPEVESFREVAAAGATEAITMPWYFYGSDGSLAAKLEAVERFGAEVIGPFSDG